MATVRPFNVVVVVVVVVSSFFRVAKVPFFITSSYEWKQLKAFRMGLQVETN
jgi:hypothetical protein